MLIIQLSFKLPGPLTLEHRLFARSSTMSKRKEKSITLFMWISSGSEAMVRNSFSSAFFTPTHPKHVKNISSVLLDQQPINLQIKAYMEYSDKTQMIINVACIVACTSIKSGRCTNLNLNSTHELNS